MRDSDAVSTFYRNPFYFRPATVAEYALWTRRWIEQGNTNIYKVDLLMDDSWDRFVVPVRNVTMQPAYGSSSVGILVPQGIKVSGELGHNDIFYINENGESCTRGVHRVNIYLDNEFDLSRAALINQVLVPLRAQVALLENELSALQ